MADPQRTLFWCDCEGSMPLDSAKLEQSAVGFQCKFGTAFCRAQQAEVREALAAGAEVVVACGQEAPLFAELAAGAEASGQLSAVDVRDRAGWSEEGANAAPKMAALLAAAQVNLPPVGSITLNSAGVCLVYGCGQAAVTAASELSERLAVTLMLREVGDAVLPAVRKFAVLSGTITQATGYLGQFEIVANGVGELIPGGRGGPQFDSPRDGGRSECDLILDLSGGQPLFADPERLEGYAHVDPADANALGRAMFELSGYVGEFEKPRYVQFDEVLCAHSRSGQVGCTRCLDVCPTSAIAPAGESVAIDPGICAGCGACASVCPSGAATYALPGVDAVRQQLEAMLQAYAAAGGTHPRLLLHGTAAAELLAALARFGRGLPANVLPLELNQPTQVNHADLLAALAAGVEQVSVLVPTHLRRAGELVALDGQVELVAAMLEGIGESASRVRVIETEDPDSLADELYTASANPVTWERVVALGDRRAATRMSLTALAVDQPPTEPVELPAGAPYGRVVIDTDKCTLCLACVGQCPTGALLDNQEQPELRFQEDLCVQCGICTKSCPESALQLEPRYLFGEQARTHISLKREEPFLCISCGKPFGTRSSIERILEQLGGKHWMFEDDAKTRMIQMCADCRVQAQYHAEDSPFRAGERPRVRTTDDYISGKVNGDGRDDE